MLFSYCQINCANPDFSQTEKKVKKIPKQATTVRGEQFVHVLRKKEEEYFFPGKLEKIRGKILPATES